jgi:hypothetical protein
MKEYPLIEGSKLPIEIHLNKLYAVTTCKLIAMPIKITAIYLIHLKCFIKEPVLHIKLFIDEFPVQIPIKS